MVTEVWKKLKSPSYSSIAKYLYVLKTHFFVEAFHRWWEQLYPFNTKHNSRPFPLL